MAPNPEAIVSFKSEKAFETWLRANHARKSEIYVRIYKKDTKVPTVTYAQALDVALCWGWIDGIRNAYDDVSFLQRFTPRKAKSRWSQINREHVARLCAAGRMTPAGQLHIDAAKADGRWDAAYASPSKLEVPPDLAAAIRAEPKAFETFQLLSRQNVYALAYRTIHIKTPTVRERRIREYVQMLKRGESIHPNSQSRSTKPQGHVTGETKKAKRATPKAITRKRLAGR